MTSNPAPTPPRAIQDPKRSGLIQSVSLAARVLGALSEADRPLTLTELARACRMGPPTAHRYLQSLIKEGLVRQGDPNGKYSLGSAALHIGLSALRQIDPVEVAADHMKSLADTIAASCGVAIWTDVGPVVVRWYRSSRFSISTVALGDILPLDNTACGLVFQAFMPAQRIQAARERQPAAFQGRNDTAQRMEQVKGDLLAERVEHLFTSLTGKAAPIFDAQNELACVVTTVSTLDAALSEDHAGALKKVAEQVCAQTGGATRRRA